MLRELRLFELYFKFIAVLDTVGDDPCQYLDDGNYPIRDVFSYIQCKNHKKMIMACKEKNTIFEPGQKKCVDVSTQNDENFCQNRTNDDYVYPWNCHMFVKCWNAVIHKFNCQLHELIFNPYTDQCNYKNIYACKQVDPSLVESVADSKQDEGMNKQLLRNVLF